MFVIYKFKFKWNFKSKEIITCWIDIMTRFYNNEIKVPVKIYLKYSLR